MSFNYKNPVTPLFSLGNVSVPRTEIFGTNFSVLSTGGYMEVYNLSDLQFTIPPGTTGLVEFSSNTIPVQINVGGGTVYSPNVLTLNSDNISSGRRRIGMLVYVINENQIYQYQIPNFTTLWNSVTGSTGPGGPTVVFSQFGTTVKNNTVAGQNFINAWTGSTIEGYSGGTRSNSNWIKYYGTDLAVTGGSFSNITNVLTLTNITGGTIPITGFTSFDRAISAFTYDNANTFIIDDNSGNTYTATINIVTGLTVNGNLLVTGNTNVNGLTATTISATTYQNLPVTFDRFVTGFTYSPNTFTIFDNSGSTFDATINTMSGLTVNGNLLVTGNTNVNGLTATTISATTYQNLPVDPDTYITGFTYSPNTFTIFDNSGSTFDATIDIVSGLTINGNLLVTGNTNVSGLSATTISATTYQNLPVTADTFVTGFTYTNNTFSLLRNQGQPNLTATINTMTGLTVNGNLTVTGNTSVQGITGTSAVFSANSQNIVTIFGSGSTQPIFVIQGSSGQLFSVTDSLVGSLFSVNDISGLPILEVFSDNTILMGSYLAPSLNTTTKISLSAGTNNIYSIPTSAYTGAFIEYTLSDTTNARSGTMMAVFSGSSVQFNETTTLDIGNTSSVTMSFVISGGNCILRATSVSSGYSIKVIIRTI